MAALAPPHICLIAIVSFPSAIKRRWSDNRQGTGLRELKQPYLPTSWTSSTRRKSRMWGSRYW